MKYALMLLAVLLLVGEGCADRGSEQPADAPPTDAQTATVSVDAETAKRQGFYRYRPIPVKVYFDDAVSCTVTECAR